MPRDVNNNFISEKNKEEHAPIYLFEIDVDDSLTLYFAEWDAEITFDGETYTPFPIQFKRIGENTDESVQKVQVVVANVSRLISAYLEDFDGLRKQEVRIKLVWLDRLDDASCYIEDRFLVDEVSVSEEQAQFTLAPKLDVLRVELPKRKFFREYCPWIFRGTECGYSGSETECNKTFQRCRELQNTLRFGGFPSIPKRQIRIS